MRTYNVEVTVTVRIDGTEEDAYAHVVKVLSRSLSYAVDESLRWDMLEGCVTEAPDDPA